MRHITGDSRQQATLLPDIVDNYADEDRPVRVIDAFVDTLDMKALGFGKAETQVTGRKPYNPGDRLKLSTGISIRLTQAVDWRVKAIAIWNCCG